MGPDAWKVFTLFVIPFGGGIPAGVLLAERYGIDWVGMTILYFLSDVVQACVFEPIIRLAIAGAKRSPFIARFNAALRKSMEMTTALYGKKLGPFALILISFGVDPMTGRAAALASGHGFVTGWIIAITGDMFYFALLMVSTIWLHGVLGDGKWASLIILVVMTAVPILIRKYRSRGTDVSSSAPR